MYFLLKYIEKIINRSKIAGTMIWQFFLKMTHIHLYQVGHFFRNFHELKSRIGLKNQLLKEKWG